MGKLKYNVGDILENEGGITKKVLLSIDGVVGLSMTDEYEIFDGMFTYKELENYGLKKVEPEKEWYENIPEDGIWCWVWNKGCDRKGINKIMGHYDNGSPNKKVWHNPCWSYQNAEPLTEEEAQKYLLK